MEWKHHSDQYVGDLRQDLTECNQFKTTRIPPKNPPFDTGDSKHVEGLRLMVDTGFVTFDKKHLFSYCMDYKGYHGEKVSTGAGGAIVIGSVAVGFLALVMASAFLTELESIGNYN